MDAEQYIKGKLDGTFTWVCKIDDKVKTKAVPLDFIPSHEKPGAGCVKRQPPTYSRPRINWTPELEEELQRLRRMGWSKLRCAHAFNTTEDTIRKAIQRMRDRKVEVV